MNFFQGAVLMALAVLAASLIWHMHRRFMRSRICGRAGITVMVRPGNDPAGLEMSIKGLELLINEGELPKNTAIVIECCGMDSETAHMARIIARDNPSVSLRDTR